LENSETNNMYEDINYTVNDPVAIIEFNREDRLNAASDKMLAELRHACAAAEADPAVVGIIITGKGRGFCAGRDIAPGGASGPSKPEGDGSLPVELGDPEIGEGYARSYAYLATLRKPVIAAVNGPCVGLGFVLAMMCDMRYIAEEAYFMSAFGQRGLVAENGISWILPRVVGIGRAMEILWSSRKVRGPEAAQLGLAEKCVPADQLVAEASAFIEMLADTIAPSSLHAMKKQLYRSLESDFGSAFDESREALAAAREGGDIEEGMTAFREKRKPNFNRIGNK
jgi:enoyl-CoA hydratase/carnithine racemase